MRLSLPLSLGLAAIAALLAGDAFASGFATAKFGGEHGTPMTDNPTAIYYNPAGIALSQGINVYATGDVAFRTVTYDRHPVAGTPAEVAEPGDARGSNSGRGSLFNIVAAPMLGVTASGKLTPSVGLAGGLALFVPFGGQATWDKNGVFKDNAKYPGPVDGTQRYYIIHGAIRTVYVSGALGLNIKDKFAIGVSGGIALNEIDSLRARNASGDTALDTEGRAWFKGSTVTPQLGGGIMIAPLDDSKKLRIGVSYQASPGFGYMKLKGTLHNFFGTDQSQDSELTQRLPDIIRAGVSFRPVDNVEVRISGDYTRWSLFDDQCIAATGEVCKINRSDDPKVDGTKTDDSGNVAANLPRRWRDSGGVHVGAGHWVRKPLELFVGAGYESAAVPDATLEASLVDFPTLFTSFGLRGQLHKHLYGTIGYTHFFFLPRDTTGKAAHLAAPSNGPDTGGTYKQNIGLLSVSLMASFDPFTKPAPAPQPGAPGSPFAPTAAPGAPQPN